MRKKNKYLDLFCFLIPEKLEICNLIREKTAELMVTMIEESFADAEHKPDGKGGSAAETRRGQWVGNMYGDDYKYLLPPRFVRFPGLLEDARGWERLVPFDSTEVDMATYMKIGRSTASASAGPQSAASAATDGENALAAVSDFMEQELLSEWKSQYPDRRDHAYAIIQGNLIVEHAHSIICSGAKFSATSAALVKIRATLKTLQLRQLVQIVSTNNHVFKCIANESDLICELLRHGAMADDSIIMQSTQLRTCVLSLMCCKKCQSATAAAAMVGMAKEAKVMCNWMRKHNKYLDFSCCLVRDKLMGYEQVREQTAELMVTIIEESFADAEHKPDGKGGSATETLCGGDGNDIPAAAEGANSAGDHASGALHRGDGNKNTVSRKTKKMKRKKRCISKVSSSMILNMVMTMKSKNSKAKRMRGLQVPNNPRLERIVGTSAARRLISSDKSMFVFC
ncbi:hypothetical protein ACP4OV_029249 [Aristida adscensionis]